MRQVEEAGRSPLEGTLRSIGGLGIVRIETRLDAVIGDVWSAFTEPRRRAHWLGAFEGDLRVGGNFNAHFWSSDWQGTGHLEICEPTKRLRVSLMQAETPEPHVMEVTLHVVDERTLIVVEERGVPLRQLPAYGAGVQIHVEDLVAHLAGGERCDAPARWKALFPSYALKPIETQA